MRKRSPMAPKLRRRTFRRLTVGGIAGTAAGVALLVSVDPAAGVPVGVGVAVAGLLLNIYLRPRAGDEDGDEVTGTRSGRR
jgi:uncharacterized membrane protein YfcA